MAYHIRSNCDEGDTMSGLNNGDCMSQKEFHALYEEMPEGFRAELIGGTVFVREPLAMPHGRSHSRLSTLFDTYAASTVGVETSIDATVILGRKDEVQPDLLLRISPEHKGQSTDYTYPKGKGPYVKGAPELVAEIAHSSRSIDLHLKRERYERAGVIEYLVVCLHPMEIHWFELRNHTTIEANEFGVFQSLVFPGLWIHETGLLTGEFKRVMDVLHSGLSSLEHDAFSARLRSAREGT